MLVKTFRKKELSWVGNEQTSNSTPGYCGSSILDPGGVYFVHSLIWSSQCPWSVSLAFELFPAPMTRTWTPLNLLSCHLDVGQSGVLGSVMSQGWSHHRIHTQVSPSRTVDPSGVSQRSPPRYGGANKPLLLITNVQSVALYWSSKKCTDFHSRNFHSY